MAMLKVESKHGNGKWIRAQHESKKVITGKIRVMNSGPTKQCI